MESAPTEPARFRPLTEITLPHSPPPDVVGSPLPEGAFSWDIRPYNGGDVQVVVDTLIYVVGVGALDNPFVQV